MSNSPTTTEPMALERMRRAPTHPGALLDEMLHAAGLTPAEAARRIGVSRAQFSHVRTGHRPMPLTMCVKVAALMGTSVEFWATLQMRHDLWHAMRDRKVAAQMRTIVPIAGSAAAVSA